MSNDPYQQQPFEDKHIEMIESWLWKPWMGTDRKTRLGSFKEGYCPACRHVMAVFQASVPVQGIAAAGPEGVKADCNCKGNHPGRPDDVPPCGCGRTGYVSPDPEPQGQGAPTNPPPAVEPLDAPEWEKAAGEVARKALDNIRSSCEKWGASVAALLGIFGAVAIVGGPTAIGEVEGDNATRIALIVLILVAGACAIVSTLYAAWGAQGGTPRVEPNWNGMVYRTHVMSQSQKAKWRLLVSRLTGIAAAVLVFAAGALLLSVSLQSANNAANESRVVVVTKAGDLVVGQIDTVTGEITTLDGQKVTNLSQVILLKEAK
jgi:hypothetical protein